MAYSTNPNLPKARATALRLLLVDRLPLVVVAHKCGIHRTTLWRWKRKWELLNQHIQRQNYNRPSRQKTINLHGYSWSIVTESSRPHSHPRTISEDLVQTVLRVRATLKRCAEVVWHHITTVLGKVVSLSSVRRILRRHHCFDGARKPRLHPDNPRRPHPTGPGELVQTDTIHHVDPFSGGRLYYYTVIDLFTRMAYTKIASRILPGLAAAAVLEAQAAWGFRLQMVQADNGPEYGRHFEQVMRQCDIAVRHSRLGRPNDNAHIERFNRTLQEECIGGYWRKSVPLPRQRQTLARYLDYYNNERVHLGIQLRTPAGMLQRF